MVPTITLIVTRGPLAGRTFCFTKPTTCVVGRARDCTIPLPLEAEHLDVSRRHCQLEIAPPGIRLRDLGSLNGTYVNERKVGQRDKQQAPADFGEKSSPSVELTAGDEIQLGEHTAFRVFVSSVTSEPDSARKSRRSSGELRTEALMPW